MICLSLQVDSGNYLWLYLSDRINETQIIKVFHNCDSRFISQPGISGVSCRQGVPQL